MDARTSDTMFLNGETVGTITSQIEQDRHSNSASCLILSLAGGGGFELLTPCVQIRCPPKTPIIKGFLRVRTQNLLTYLSGVSLPSELIQRFEHAPTNLPIFPSSFVSPVAARSVRARNSI